MKHLIFVFAVLFLIGACQTSTSEHSSETNVNVSVDEFLSNPEGYVDQMISVNGLITHVCMHGGQKLFIAGEKEGNFLRISAGERLAEFPLDLEGNIAEFQGLVLRMEPVISLTKVIPDGDNHEDHTCSAEQLSTSRASYYISANNFTIIK